jgi:iturin family lipopeptide synthetase A
MRTITLNRHRLNIGAPVELIAKSDKDAVELISEGKAIPYCQVRITDDEDQPLPEDRIGNVQMSGENVTRGYFENPEANAASISSDGWVRTGDMGLFHQGRSCERDHLRQRPELLSPRPRIHRTTR